MYIIAVVPSDFAIEVFSIGVDVVEGAVLVREGVEFVELPFVLDELLEELLPQGLLLELLELEDQPLDELLLDDERVGDELAPLLLEDEPEEEFELLLFDELFDEPEPPDDELVVVEGVVVVVVRVVVFVEGVLGVLGVEGDDGVGFGVGVEGFGGSV